MHHGEFVIEPTARHPQRKNQRGINMSKRFVKVGALLFTYPVKAVGQPIRGLCTKTVHVAYDGDRQQTGLQYGLCPPVCRHEGWGKAQGCDKVVLAQVGPADKSDGRV